MIRVVEIQAPVMRLSYVTGLPQPTGWHQPSGQFATMCHHPGCDGRIVSVDVARPLAEQVAFDHRRHHEQDDDAGVVSNP